MTSLLEAGLAAAIVVVFASGYVVIPRAAAADRSRRRGTPRRIAFRYALVMTLVFEVVWYGSGLLLYAPIGLSRSHLHPLIGEVLILAWGLLGLIIGVAVTRRLLRNLDESELRNFFRLRRRAGDDYPAGP